MKKGELIELRHLRYFITLAKELHFARAAERLQIEQSPLSRAIREMERLLGVSLFERITRAGKVLVDYARRVIALVEQARTSARSAALGHSNHLRVGVSDCTAYCRVAEALTHDRTTNPDISVSLHMMPLHQQINWIRDDLLDASISVDGSYRDGLQALAVARGPICAIVPIAHPLVHVEVALPTELVRHPFDPVQSRRMRLASTSASPRHHILKAADQHRQRGVRRPPNRTRVLHDRSEQRCNQREIGSTASVLVG